MIANVDIYWKDGFFSTIQGVDTIEAALAKYNSGPHRLTNPKTVADVDRYEIIADDDLTAFGKMFAKPRA